jgi:hypothetical protein
MANIFIVGVAMNHCDEVMPLSSELAFDFYAQIPVFQRRCFQALCCKACATLTERCPGMI